MKARIVRKLKFTWRANAPIQPFFASKDHSHHIVDVNEGKPASCPSSDREGMLAPSVRTREEIDSVSPVQSNSDSHVPPEAESLAKSESEEANKEQVKCEDKPKPLLISDFQDRSPPGGTDSIVVYTTSLRGIRKTFEDCNTVRFLLDSFRVMYSERDVSMHLEYREELWGILGGRIVPPRLFIKGRYIGGADEVVTLHEKGMLQNLLQGIPLCPSSSPCKGCAGMRFVLCPNCDGSRKVLQNDEPYIRCPDCNENGLVKCSVCG